MDKQLKEIELSGGFEWTPGSPWPPSIDLNVGTGNTSVYTVPIEHSDAWYDYTRNDPDLNISIDTSNFDTVDFYSTIT